MTPVLSPSQALAQLPQLDFREKVNGCLHLALMGLRHGRYPKTALLELLGVTPERVDDNRLYRGMSYYLLRSDCKQVCIALIETRSGLPLGYEVFAGNTVDVTTVQQIVGKIEGKYGKSNRIWVMDRGMTSEDNLELLRQENRRYIIGTNKSLLKKFEQELLKQDWHTIREGIEVKLCKMPEQDDDSSRVDNHELLQLCLSSARKEKDQKIVSEIG